MPYIRSCTCKSGAFARQSGRQVPGPSSLFLAYTIKSPHPHTPVTHSVSILLLPQSFLLLPALSTLFSWRSSPSLVFPHKESPSGCSSVQPRVGSAPVRLCTKAGRLWGKPPLSPPAHTRPPVDAGRYGLGIRWWERGARRSRPWP